MRYLASNKWSDFHSTHVKILELICISAVGHPYIICRLMLPPSLHKLLEREFDKRFTQLLFLVQPNFLIASECEQRLWP